MAVKYVDGASLVDLDVERCGGLAIAFGIGDGKTAVDVLRRCTLTGLFGSVSDDDLVNGDDFPVELKRKRLRSLPVQEDWPSAADVPFCSMSSFHLPVDNIALPAAP